MFLYDIHNMDSILGPSIRANRRLRSLHIPSPEVHSNSSRRFNSLRATTATNTIATEEDDDDMSVRIRLVPNVGSTNRCFVFDVVDRKLIAGGPSIKLGRYSDRTVISDRLSFKSKVVSRYHAEIWLGKDKKVTC